MSTNPCCAADRVRPRSSAARSIAGVLLLGVTWLSGVFIGSFAESARPRWIPRAIRTTLGLAREGGAVEEPRQDARRDASRAGFRARAAPALPPDTSALERALREIEDAAKVDRIAYRILRERGYTDDADECKRLVARQRDYERLLREVAASLERVRRREELELRARHGAVPDDRWLGGPDVFMRIEKDAVSPRGETGIETGGAE